MGGYTNKEQGTHDQQSLGDIKQRPDDRTAPLLPGPPDGGRKAWAQVLVSHLCVFNSFGYINSFGIFQQYYVGTLSLPPPMISWIGSIQILLVYLVGAFSGRALDAGYYRLILLAGVTLQIVGVFMTSLSSQYWQLLLAQGICQGLGDGLIFCPAVANTATYFTRSRTMAISCVACGGATGGMAFPAIARALLDRIGFPWTLRVMGFVMLFNAVVIMSLARTRLQTRSGGPLVEWKAFTELPYCYVSLILQNSSAVNKHAARHLTVITRILSQVHSFSRDIIAVTDRASFNLILIINSVGVPGRLVPAFIADKYFGPMNVFIPVMFAAGILLFCWAAVSNLPGITVFTIFYGFFGAGVQSLLQAALASLNTDLKKTGVRIGMGFSIVGIASLTGSPIDGGLVEKGGGSYIHAQIFAGGIVMVGCLVLVAARIAKTGFRLYERV